MVGRPGVRQPRVLPVREGAGRTGGAERQGNGHGSVSVSGRFQSGPDAKQQSQSNHNT